MSWIYGQTDKYGRSIGNKIEGVCDEDGCKAKVFRNMSYSCGGMLGESEYGCGKFFCKNHVHDSIVGYICLSCIAKISDIWEHVALDFPTHEQEIQAKIREMLGEIEEKDTEES